MIVADSSDLVCSLNVREILHFQQASEAWICYYLTSDVQTWRAVLVCAKFLKPAKRRGYPNFFFARRLFGKHNSEWSDSSTPTMLPELRCKYAQNSLMSEQLFSNVADLNKLPQYFPMERLFRLLTKWQKIFADEVLHLLCSGDKPLDSSLVLVSATPKIIGTTNPSPPSGAMNFWLI